MLKGKTCILVDDIIDSGGTILNAAKALKQRGAKEVYVYITHGVLSGDAVKKIKNSVIKNIPLGKVATESDIASAVVYLASDAASMMTGSSLVIDGGWTAK